MNKMLRNPPYNLLIHSAPLQETPGDFYHWHVEIIPKLTKVAGFEWATGSTSTRRHLKKPHRFYATPACRHSVVVSGFSRTT
jgi:hypothetical protein